MTREEYLKGNTCLTKAAEDEPLFVLRARDITAPGTVRDWTRRAAKQGVAQAKIDEALATAQRMTAWAKVNGGAKVPD